MLKDLVPQFAETLEKFPSIILDNYELKEGIYIRLSLDKPFVSIEEHDFVIISKNSEEQTSKLDLIRLFKVRDYYSSILNDDMNKAVDIPAKKIHSNNYLSLFAKKDYLIQNKKDDIKNHLLNFLKVNVKKSEERLFEIFPIKSNKKSERQRLESFRDQYFQENYHHLVKYLFSNERKIQKNKVNEFWTKYFENILEKIIELVSENKVNNYIKLFFDVEEEQYRKEYEIYILSRIFNVNDYNELIEGEIMGLPAYDVSMNSKKPFFEYKTMKIKVPTRTSLEEAIYIKDFYNWLNKQGKFKEIYLPFHEPFGSGTGNEKAKDVAKGAYHISLDSNGSIQYFDNVPFQPKDAWNLEIENVLEIQEKINGVWVFKSDQQVTSKYQLRNEISRLFFGNSLPNNLLETEPPKAIENKFTVEMVSIYTMIRQALFDFLVKDSVLTIRPFIKKYSLQLIEIQLLKTIEENFFYTMAEAFLLRLALLKMLNDEEGIKLSDRIKELFLSLKEKLSIKNELVTCDSDEEFFFLAGQLGSYLLAQSETSNKTFGLAEPIIKAKNPQVLKNKLADLFDTYKHSVHYDYVAFRNAFAMVQGYETDAKIIGFNKNILLAGLLANNIFFQKKDKEE